MGDAISQHPHGMEVCSSSAGREWESNRQRQHGYTDASLIFTRKSLFR